MSARVLFKCNDCGAAPYYEEELDMCCAQCGMMGDWTELPTEEDEE